MLEKIEMKKVAYLIGYLAGDGSFEGGNGKRTDRLSFTTADKEIFDWILNNFDINETNKVIRGNNEVMGIFASKDAYRKTFPISYSDDFNKYGILCKKAERMIHNIRKEFMKYWLLGFIDSDGMISWSVRSDRDRIAAKVAFTHPGLKLLERVQTFLREELNITSSIRPKGKEKCFVLEFSKLSDVKKFGDYIYSDKSAIVLERKYKKHLELSGEITERVGAGTLFPKEFMQSCEYGQLVGSYSKYMFICPDGREIPSAAVASNYFEFDRKDISRWCRMNQKGWSSREKTESEKTDYDKYIKRKVKQAFNTWLESNPIYN